MTVKEKVNQYIEYKGININAFEASIGASKSYWRNTKNISAEILVEIIRVYSDLSAEWLLRGEGEMLRGNDNALDNATLKKEIVLYVDENGFLKIKK